MVVSSCWAWTAYSINKKKKKKKRKKKLSPVHFGSFFSTHCPRMHERIFFPSNMYPSRQRYLALERRMFMLMIVFFGGFLRRRRSILSQLLSRSAAINMKCNLIALTIIKPLFNSVKAGGNFCRRRTTNTGAWVACSAGVFFGRAMVLLFLLSPIFLCHKIKDGGYNNTNICNESKYCHVTPLLVDLHCLPVKFRIEFKILLIVFKIFTGLAPSYLISTSYLITPKLISI